MEKTIGAYEARRRFGQLIEEAFYRRDHFIVERAGRPMAVIVSINDYERWQRLAKARFFSMLDAVWGRTEGVPTEEIEKDVDEALANADSATNLLWLINNTEAGAAIKDAQTKAAVGQPAAKVESKPMSDGGASFSDFKLDTGEVEAHR